MENLKIPSFWNFFYLLNCIERIPRVYSKNQNQLETGGKANHSTLQLYLLHTVLYMYMYVSMYVSLAVSWEDAYSVVSMENGEGKCLKKCGIE